MRLGSSRSHAAQSHRYRRAAAAVVRPTSRLRWSLYLRRASGSSLDDSRNILEAALGEVERHHKVGCGRSEARERIRGPEAQDLVEDQQLAEIHGDKISNQLVGLKPVSDLRGPVLKDR